MNVPNPRTETVKKWAAGIGVCLLAFAVVAGMWTLLGPLNTIIYLVLFAVGAGGIPAFIYLAAPSFPRFLAEPIGRGMWILQQMALGTGYLVEFDREYRMCPGEDGLVYIEGEWHEVEGMDNMTVLGWQPFGSLRYKDEDTLDRERVDDGPRSEQSGTPSAGEIATSGIGDLVQSDGGRDQTSVETRGGYADVGQPQRSDSWVIDLTRVFDSGLRKMGDITNIEKSEENAIREEAEKSATAGREAIIGSIVGLVLGIATGYVVLMA